MPSSFKQLLRRFHLWGLLFAAVFLLPLLMQELPSDDNVIFSHQTGYYEDGLNLKLIGPRNGRVIYTMDGSLPTLENGETYQDPIELSAGEAHFSLFVVRARSVNSDSILGQNDVLQTFLIGGKPELPLVSLSISPNDLWHEQSGIYLNPEEKGLEWERTAVFTYFPSQNINNLPLNVSAGVRIHGQFSRNYDKKSFRLYFREQYGQSHLEYPIFPESEVGMLPRHKRVVIHAGGQDAIAFPSNWTLIRNQLMANLSLQTRADATRSQPILLYLNGEPWGIYYLRERIGDFWLEDELNVGNPLIVDTQARRFEKPNDNGRGLAYWDQLTAYAANNDLTQPEHYAFMQSQIDFENFIDYSILQIYSANFDWPFTNVLQYKPETQGGKWQWVFWDNDLSLGLQPWSVVQQTTIEQALDPAYDGGTGLETNGRDTVLLRALLRNPDFHAQFVGRWQELMQTTLAVDNVIREIDLLAAEIDPHIDFETDRWGSSREEWQMNVEGLRNFARERPLVMQLQLENFLAAPLP